LAVALLLVGAGIGLHLEERENVTRETALHALEALGRAIETRTSTQPVLDDLDWSACTREDRCVTEIRARTRTSDLVLVRAFAGPQGLHLVIERLPASAPAETAQTRITLPKNEEATWDASLAPAVAALFPEVKTRADIAVAPPTAAPRREEEAISVAPWIVFGASALALGTGVAFGLSSRSAREQIERSRHDQLEYDELSGRQSAHGMAANVLFGAAAAGAVAGVVMLIID
jgi:hypothetical protein